LTDNLALRKPRVVALRRIMIASGLVTPQVDWVPASISIRKARLHTQARRASLAVRLCQKKQDGLQSVREDYGRNAGRLQPAQNLAPSGASASKPVRDCGSTPADRAKLISARLEKAQDCVQRARGRLDGASGIERHQATAAGFAEADNALPSYPAPTL
jgi:hypothetical protein